MWLGGGVVSAARWCVLLWFCVAAVTYYGFVVQCMYNVSAVALCSVVGQELEADKSGNPEMDPRGCHGIYNTKIVKFVPNIQKDKMNITLCTNANLQYDANAVI